MRTAVIYFSKTGNSKKIAEAVAADLQTDALDIRSAPVLDSVDLLFIVGGIYGGASSPELQAYVAGISSTSVRKAALITSCLSKLRRQDMIREVLIRNEVDVAPDEFVCRGRLLFLGLGHPNKQDIDSAVSFARRTVSEHA